MMRTSEKKRKKMDYKKELQEIIKEEFFTKTISIGAGMMPRAVTRYFAHKMNQ